MSNYWDLYCVDCKVKADAFWWNHGELELARLVPVLPHFAALDHALGETTVTWPGAEWASMAELTKFAREHAGHAVKPISEYGYVSEQCSRYCYCSECGAKSNCALPDGHDGPHQRATK